MDLIAGLIVIWAVLGVLVLMAWARLEPRPENTTAEQMTEYHAAAIRKALIDAEDTSD